MVTKRPGTQIFSENAYLKDGWNILDGVVATWMMTWRYLENTRGWCHCPMTWVYWTSPKIGSHKKDHKYGSWLGDVKHGDMTNDP